MQELMYYILTILEFVLLLLGLYFGSYYKLNNSKDGSNNNTMTPWGTTIIILLLSFLLSITLSISSMHIESRTCENLLINNVVNGNETTNTFNFVCNTDIIRYEAFAYFYNFLTFLIVILMGVYFFKGMY